jgi:putative ABC transport system permease protein
MRQLAATLRRRPGPLVGTFVALWVAAVVVTMAASLARTGQTLHPPVQRLAATAAVVTGDPKARVKEGGDTSRKPLPAYRRLPASLAQTLAMVKGVQAATPDVSIPVALELPSGATVTGTTADPVTGHGWSSAALTPFTLRAGHAPRAVNQIVVGAGLAAHHGLALGSRVRLAGQPTPPLEVVGLAGTEPGNPAQDWTVFFTDAEAGQLYGHPGQADLIGILGHPDRQALLRAAKGATVTQGASRGDVERPDDAADGSNLSVGALSAGIDVAMIALFVVAGAVGLSVGQRGRAWALLRAVGATPGQVRRMLAVELGVLGLLAGLFAYLPGLWLSSWALRGLAGHRLVPPASRLGAPLWVLAITVGAGLVVAELARFVAARRVSRLAPAAAIGEAQVQRRWPSPLRVLLGLAALGGGVALGVFALDNAGSATDRLNFTLFMLLALLAAVALLGPLLVAAAELALRLPLRLLAPVAARLGLAEVRVWPRRVAPAVVAIALSVAFAGAFYVVDATQTHAAVVQGPLRLKADVVLSAPGPGLSPDALRSVQDTPGVIDSIGLTPTTVLTPNPGSESTSAEAVTPGDLKSVLDLDVVAGSLDRFGPGDIALSRLVAGGGAVGAKVGDTITTYLADGTPYRATVTAVFDRSIGFADALIPAGAAGGGHLGTSAIGSVLARTGTPATAGRLRELAARFPGLQAADRTVINAEDERLDAQGSYLNNLILCLLAALAALTLVNTLVVTALERRDTLRLVERVGATTRQLVRVTALQAVALATTGIVLGAAVGTAAVFAATKALTGGWQPYVHWPAPVVLVVAVAALCLTATVVPSGLVLNQRKTG